MMGYDPVRHEVSLRKGQSLELNFEITENGITMDDVVVSASRSETMSYTPGAITSPGWVRRWRKEMGAGMEGLEEGADSDMAME